MALDLGKIDLGSNANFLLINQTISKAQLPHLSCQFLKIALVVQACDN